MRPQHQPIRVVVLDDHAVVQHGIATYLTEKTGIEVVASFAKSRDLIRWLEAHHADVVLLDYTLGPGEIDGLNLVKLVNTRFPDCRILMTSSSDTPTTVTMNSPSSHNTLEEINTCLIEPSLQRRRASYPSRHSPQLSRRRMSSITGVSAWNSEICRPMYSSLE